MTSSDIIAIVAISVSAITSIVTAVMAYLTNKANISARRAELASEKRLEALSTIVGHVEKIKYLLQNVSIPRKADDSWRKLARQLIELEKGFLVDYEKYKIYIPVHISNEIDKFEGSISLLISIYNVAEGEAPLEEELRCYKQEEKIIKLIQEFIGF